MSGYIVTKKAQVPLPKMLLERLRVSLHLVQLSGATISSGWENGVISGKPSTIR